jgi:hypothetical protein
MQLCGGPRMALYPTYNGLHYQDTVGFTTRIAVNGGVTFDLFFLDTRFRSPARPVQEYCDVGHTQQHKRKRLVKDYAAAWKVPLTELNPPRLPASVGLHLSAKSRRDARSMGSGLAPSERRIIRLRNYLAVDKGTGTRWFKTDAGAIGAYATDPLRAIEIITSTSPWLIVGADTGGSITKVGVTYLDVHSHDQFLCLGVTLEKDNYEGLALFGPNYQHILQLSGKSAGLSLWGALQSLTNQPAKLLQNGDWVLTNAILGLKTAVCYYPCPICVVHKDNFLATAETRMVKPGNREYSQDRDPLFHVSASFIVPLPLHLFLGICNKIITDVFIPKLGEDVVMAARKKCKTIHATTYVGRASIHTLTGSELTTWIKGGITESLMKELAAFGGHGTRKATNTIKNIPTLAHWMKELHRHLLHAKDWTEQQHQEFSLLVNEIQSRWVECTETPVIPKVHMLTHAVEFIC